MAKLGLVILIFPSLFPLSFPRFAFISFLDILATSIPTGAFLILNSLPLPVANIFSLGP